MTSNSERLLLFGLLGLIAWELWPKQSAVPSIRSINDPLSNTPPWIQQLSLAEQLDGGNQNPDMLETLLSIPQGPGGSPSVMYGPGGSASGQNITNFFNPTQGINFCNQSPSNIVRPSTWSVA